MIVQHVLHMQALALKGEKENAMIFELLLSEYEDERSEFVGF